MLSAWYSIIYISIQDRHVSWILYVWCFIIQIYIKGIQVGWIIYIYYMWYTRHAFMGDRVHIHSYSYSHFSSYCSSRICSWSRFLEFRCILRWDYEEIKLYKTELLSFLETITDPAHTPNLNQWSLNEYSGDTMEILSYVKRNSSKFYFKREIRMNKAEPPDSFNFSSIVFICLGCISYL